MNEKKEGKKKDKTREILKKTKDSTLGTSIERCLKMEKSPVYSKKSRVNPEKRKRACILCDRPGVCTLQRVLAFQTLIWQDRALFIISRALCLLKRALQILKRALHILKSAAYAYSEKSRVNLGKRPVYCVKDLGL